MRQPKVKRTSRQHDRISVRGFKSIRDETQIEIRPLTLLAGANSSGKSSIIQPLLLLKQTLEAPYDQGPLRLHGENARFAAADQLFWHGKRRDDRMQDFAISFAGESVLGGSGFSLGTLVFAADQPQGVALKEVTYEHQGRVHALREGMTDAELLQRDGEVRQPALEVLRELQGEDLKVEVERGKCFLYVRAALIRNGQNVPFYSANPLEGAERLLTGLIHLPGLRGMPERFYPATQVGSVFPGTFPPYTASVLSSWQRQKDERLENVGEALSTLGLSWKVDARSLDDTRVELRVGRLPKPSQGGAQDLVNIADVGVGTSQVLPLIVALAVATPGQIVYVEQPEIHLHPRAQVALADNLLEAARRGVIVIAETHSHLLLRGVQASVAAQRSASELVKLHWFRRTPEGVTSVASADIDADGTFGDWPEDFADTELEIERRFLKASLGTE